MANARKFASDSPNFFPRTGDRAREEDFAAQDAANANDVTPVEEREVWDRYQPSSAAMFDKPDADAKNVHSSSRWWVRGAVAAFFIAGVAIAAATYQGRNPAEPVAVEDASSAAAAPTIQNPREASVPPSLSGGAAGATMLAEPAAAEPAAPAATAPVKQAAKAVAKPAPRMPAQTDPADAAAAPTYSQAAPASAPTPTSPANPTSTLPPIMPESTAPGQPSAQPAPVPGSASTIPEITPGNEPTPE